MRLRTLKGLRQLNIISYSIDTTVDKFHSKGNKNVLPLNTEQHTQLVRIECGS